MQCMLRHQNRFFLAFTAFRRKNFSDPIPSQSESQGSPFLRKIIFLSCRGSHVLAMFPQYSCHAPPHTQGHFEWKICSAKEVFQTVERFTRCMWISEDLEIHISWCMLLQTSLTKLIFLWKELHWENPVISPFLEETIKGVLLLFFLSSDLQHKAAETAYQNTWIK